MLYIGIPSGIQSVIFSFTNVIIQASINTLGEAAATGSAASGNIEGFVYIAMNAVYHVALTFIGQNVGARKYKNIRRLTVYCSFMVAVIGLSMAVVAVILKNQILGLYVDTEASLQAATARFMIIIPTYFLCGVMEVFCGVLRALDRSLTSMIISLLGVCGLRILWIETMFVWFPSEFNIYITYPISWVITAIFQLLFIIITAKKMLARDRQRGAISQETPKEALQN